MAESEEEREVYEGFSERLYTPIDSSKKFNRDEFVDSFGDFSDLEKYIQALTKDSSDPSAISDLGALLHKDPNFYEGISNPAKAARVEADRAYSQGIDSMAQHVKRNLDDFFKRTEDNDVVNYITRINLYKTGNEKHDEFVDALNSMREIAEIARSGDSEKVGDYVKRKLENVQDWVKEAFAILQSDSTYAQALYRNFADHDQKEFEKKLIDKDGKIRRNFLEGVIKNSLEEAHEQYNKETHKGDKQDIWKICIRPYYIELARTIYPKEKKKSKGDIDPEREKRKAERAEIGMPA